MQLSFSSLLKLHLQHDYFPENRSEGLSVVPTNSCQRILQALDLRVVNRDYGIEIFSGKREGQAAAILQTDGVVRLSFWLRITDPLFYNYTMGLPGQNALLYHSNRETADTSWTLDGGEALPLRNSLSPEERTNLRNVLGEEVEDDSLPAGRYQISTAAGTEDFLFAGDGYQPGDVGLLSLFVTGDTPTEYVIRSTARAVYWQYYLINNQPEADTATYRISGGEAAGVHFFVPEEPLTRTLPGGQTAVLLQSDQAIPLRKRSALSLQLQVEQGGQSLSIPLPAADPRSLRPPAEEEQLPAGTLIADIYVYL